MRAVEGRLVWPFVALASLGPAAILAVARPEDLTVAGVALALGLVITALALAVAALVTYGTTRWAYRRAFGPSRVLIVTWNAEGARTTTERNEVWVPYSQIRRVRRVKGFTVLRGSVFTRLSVAIPDDLVPPPAEQWLTRAVGQR